MDVGSFCHDAIYVCHVYKNVVHILLLYHTYIDTQVHASVAFHVIGILLDSSQFAVTEFTVGQVSSKFIDRLEDGLLFDKLSATCKVILWDQSVREVFKVRFHVHLFVAVE